MLVRIIAACGLAFALMFLYLVFTAARMSPHSIDRFDGTTVRFWNIFIGQPGDSMDGLAHRFNHEHKSIRVESIYKVRYDVISTALTSADGSDEKPGVALVSSADFKRLKEAGLLLDMKPFIEGPNGIDMSLWPEALRIAGKLDNGIYWLPFNLEVPILYVNETHLIEAGFSRPPTTWDELLTYAPRLSKIDSRGFVEQYQLALWSTALPFLSMVWSDGGEITTGNTSDVSLDDSAFKERLEVLQQLVYKHTLGISPGDESGGATHFVNGYASMLLDDQLHIKDVIRFSENKVGRAINLRPVILQCPEGPAGRSYPIIGGGLVMLAHSNAEQREATWEWIRYLFEDRQLADFALGTGYLAFTPGAQSLVEQDDASPEIRVVHAATQYLRCDFSVEQSPPIKAAFERAIRRTLVDKENVTSVLREEDSNAERQLQQSVGIH